MSSRRHHIHIICVPNDQSLVLDCVAIFFQTRAFLTYDVSSALPRAALYGRQCIDDCDYAVLVIGHSYGATQNKGVSQMHLSYLSAKAKMKPMLILIKNHQESTEVSPQLKDFIKLVERQNIGISYYASANEIDRHLSHSYEAMVERHPALSWVRENQTLSPIRDISKDIDKDVENTVAISPPSTKKQADTLLPAQDSFDSVTKPLNLEDVFEFQYSAQAYEGGNLTDVVRSLSCTWQEILNALIKIPLSFSSYGLQSVINRLIATKAEYDIKQHMPNVHAVARCQIKQADLVNLQHALVAANWIQLASVGARPSQELWRLTFYAKKIHEESQFMLNKVQQ